MSSEYAQPLIPVLGLILNVVVQVFFCRYVSRTLILKSTYLESIFLGFATGGMGVIIFEIYLFLIMQIQLKEFISLLIVNLITFSGLGYCYSNFTALGISALRIRILREIDESKEGLTIEECMQLYSPVEMVEIRTKRLVNNGQIIYRNGKYYIGKSTLLLLANIINALKLIIIGEKRI